MKTLTPKLLTLILVSTLLFSCAKEDDGIYFDAVSENINEDLTKNVNYSKIEIDILTIVNSYRESIGINKLTSLDIISGVADGHTNYMIQEGKISHDNFSQRAETLMYQASAKSVAENVAYGYNSAQAVVDGWLGSETHRALIENPNFTHFGISTEANADGRNYFTQMFIKK